MLKLRFLFSQALHKIFLNINSMRFKMSLCSKASSRNPNMAIWGKILVRFKTLLWNSSSCLHKMEAFLHLWKKYIWVSSSVSQKEHRIGATFLNLKSNLLTKRILLWKNIIVATSLKCLISRAKHKMFGWINQ